LKLDPALFNYPPEQYDPRRREGRLHPQLEGLMWSQVADGSVAFKLKSRKGGKDKSVKQPSVKLDATTPDEAINEWQILTGSIAQGKHVMPNNKRTWDDGWALLKERLDAQLAVGAKRRGTFTKHEINYRLHIRPVFGKRAINSVTTEEWAEFWLACAVTNKNTRLTIKTTINRIYRRAIRKGWCFENTHAGLEDDERPQKPTKEERSFRVIRVEDTLAMIERCNPIYRTMLIVLACTGLRISELCGLRWCDIDPERGVLWVNGQLVRDPERGLVYDPIPKTGTSYRRVILRPLAARALKAQRVVEWGKGYGKDSDFVFTASEGPRERGRAVGVASGKPIAPDNFRNRGVIAAAEKAGLGHVKPHDLRHTTASIFAEAGLSPAEAAKMMGHTEKTYIEVYVHAFQDEQAFQTIRTKLVGIGLGDDDGKVAI